VIAAIILLVLLWGTWRYITFSFIEPEDVNAPPKQTAPLA